TNGIAKSGFAIGEVEVVVSSGDWYETKAIEIKSDRPAEVEFHREWKGKRTLLSQMILDGKPYQPGENLKLYAWTDRSPIVAKIHEPVLRKDSFVEVNYDLDSVCLLVIDRDRHYSGFVEQKAGEASQPLVMQKTAAYSGRFLE